MYKNGERMMAWVAKIDKVEKHPEADALDICTVGGWKCVTKLGEFQEGQLAVYCSIDSWIPTNLAPFLSKGKEPREFNGVKGERLRTVKLRGALSQGLLLPLNDLLKMKYDSEVVVAEGDDVTEMLGIQKWEMPIPAQLAGQVRGPFPSAIPKTDQERVQNLVEELNSLRDSELSEAEFEVTEKLEGASCTMYLDFDGDFHVCSRNLDLKETPENSLWQAARKFNVEDKMKNANLFGFALQGELIGPGVQGNIYKLAGIEFHIFDVYDVHAGDYLDPADRRNLIKGLQLTHVPVIDTQLSIKTLDNDKLITLADGKSMLNVKQDREGLVFKHTEGGMTFKAISNKYLFAES